MPELPEVETIRLGLKPHIVGQNIKAVKLLWRKSFQGSTLETLGAKVTGIARRGKVLIIALDNGYSLLIHLKMTGQLVYDPKPRKQIRKSNIEIAYSAEAAAKAGRNKSKITNSKSPNSFEFRNPVKGPEGPHGTFSGSKLGFGDSGVRIVGGHPTKSMLAKLPDSSTRVIFTFKSGDKLYFNDQRKFGWIKLVESSKVESQELLSRMGPEPLKNGLRITSGLRSRFGGVGDFESRIKKRKAPIKAVLLDQSTLAGLGNIYVDEALHLAKIHPLRKGQSLTQKEVERLREAIIEILSLGLRHGGTSMTNYVNARGQRGNYLERARVFRREGQPCPVCGTPIQKIKVAGRGTHICPRCQRQPRA